MPLPALGLEERVGLAVEGTYGVLESPTNAILGESFGVEKVQVREPVPGRFGPVRGFRGAVAAQARRVALPAKQQGPWVVPMDFVEMMLIAHSVIDKTSGGASLGYTFTADTDGDGNSSAPEPNRHVFQMQNHTSDMPLGLTLIRFNGQRQDAFLGCHIRSWELSIPENGIAVVNMDVLGQGLTKSSAETLPAFSSSPYGRITEARVAYSTTVGDARASLTFFANVSSINLRVQHVYRERAVTGTGPTPANVIAQPIPIDYSVVEGSFITDWDQDTWQDIQDAATVNGTYVCLEIRITSEVMTTGATSPFEFIARMPACHLTGKYPADPGGPGPIQEEITFMADVFDNSGTFETLDLEFYNDEVEIAAI